MKKNVIYIFADEWRSHAVGHRNQDPVQTPNMDEFAKQSCDFTNAVSSFPVCSPQRAAMISGRYPYECGVTTNCKTGLSGGQIMLAPQERTISDVLYKEGYQTAYVGKWHLDACDRSFNDNPESKAENWDGFTPPGERRHHFEFWHAYNAMDHHLAPHYWEDTNEKIFIDKWSPEHETDVVIDYLDNRDKEKPFCVYLSYNPPHPPFDEVPEKYYNIYKDMEIEPRPNVPQEMRENEEYQTRVRQYYAAVTGVDEQFGRIINYLKQNNMWDDTLIVLTADHGEYMGSHNKYGKSLWHEESISIPLYFAGAGVTPNVCESPIGGVDHMPTILDYLGVEIPNCVSGTSFAHQLKKDSADYEQKVKEEPQEAFLTMTVGGPQEYDAFFELGLHPACFGWRGLKTNQHTYVLSNGWMPGNKQERYLYDNIADPYQLNPTMLSAEEAKDWDTRLKKYLDLTRDPFLMKSLW